MNTRMVKSKFNNFRIILDSGFSSKIVMGIIALKLNPKKDYVMQWHTQSSNITNNHKVEVVLTLLAFSAKNVVMWEFHVDDSAKGRCSMILWRDLLTELGLHLKFSDHVIESDYGPFKGYITTMVDLVTYEFKYLNTGKITPEELFTNAYVEEACYSEHVRTDTKRLHLILDAK